MNGQVSIIGKYYRWRSKVWRNRRMWFPSPYELRFIKLMGGRYITVPFIKDYKTGFRLAYVVSLGRVLNTELVRREVRVGSKYVDFGNDIRRGIEIDGDRYHNDIVAQQERDEYFAGYCDRKCAKPCSRHANQGWRVLHIRPSEIDREPANVQQRVLQFFYE